MGPQGVAGAMEPLKASQVDLFEGSILRARMFAGS
jgi:hypothetical protein